MNKPLIRYHATKMDTTSALILDTQEGHCWLWGAHEKTGLVLMYQGQVSPGEEPGEVIVQIPPPNAK